MTQAGGGLRQEEALAVNLASWDERAGIHARDETGFYGIDRLISGAILLTPIERAELGDLGGLRVAHLQCHIGTDTLSLKRLGAREVVGLDFSPVAVSHARGLALRTGLDVRFVQGGVYDAPMLLGTDHDLVYTSWGTICWLGDLDRWARAAVGALRPGGRLYFADAHPAVLLFENDGTGGMSPRYDFATPPSSPLAFDNEHTYDGSSVPLVNRRTHEWIHPISRVLNALISAGLALEWVHEHEALPWRLLDVLEAGPDRLFRFPAGHVRLPLSWSLAGIRRPG